MPDFTAVSMELSFSTAQGLLLFPLVLIFLNERNCRHGNWRDFQVALMALLPMLGAVHSLYATIVAIETSGKMELALAPHATLYILGSWLLLPVYWLAYGRDRVPPVAG